MAICDDLPGLEVEIIHNGAPLKEYIDDAVAEDERTVTRYIEAKTGAEFCVKLKVARGTVIKGDCLTGHIEVDGYWTCGAILRKIDFKTGNYATVVKGREIKGGMVQMMKFACIETATDARALQGGIERFKHLGSIVVKVSHDRMLHRLPNTTLESETRNLDIVPEKALKGKGTSHSIMLTGPVKLPNGPSPIYSTQPIRGMPNPAALFVFHYRSVEALKAMLIVPRTPSPPPLEDMDISTMSMDQLREYTKKLQERVTSEEAATNIKREREEANPRPRKKTRPNASSMHLEIDDDGNFREGSSSATPAAEPEVIELE